MRKEKNVFYIIFKDEMKNEQSLYNSAGNFQGWKYFLKITVASDSESPAPVDSESDKKGKNGHRLQLIT